MQSKIQLKYIISIAVILIGVVIGISNDKVQKALNLGRAVQDVELQCKTASSSDFSIAADTSVLIAATNTQQNRLWVRISATNTPDVIWAAHFNGLPALQGHGLPIFSSSTEKIEDYYGEVYARS